MDQKCVEIADRATLATIPPLFLLAASPCKFLQKNFVSTNIVFESTLPEALLLLDSAKNGAKSTGSG